MSLNDDVEQRRLTDDEQNAARFFTWDVELSEEDKHLLIFHLNFDYSMDVSVPETDRIYIKFVDANFFKERESNTALVSLDYEISASLRP